MDSLKDTEQFMRAAGQHIPSEPALPSHDLAQFRLGLLHEELSELEEAFLAGDMVGVLDALCDLRVVLDGAVLACGMKDVYPAALAEVARSNMSKFPDCERRLAIDQRCYQEQGIPVRFSRYAEHWVILRQSDGKVLKSTGYSPANLVPLLPCSTPC
jgi:predicted HAD superfamily Cof-like phosphohydrolase